ncbi:MAG: corrinoid protein [candidate division Zixibacteria bacterium]|nr:corrinoid protein [candidate division Zixibacteria bacterium]
MTILEEISDCLQKGDDTRVREITRKAVEEGLPPESILNDGLIAGMNVIGEKFKIHEIFLPDVLLAARAMYTGMEILKPLFIKGQMPTRGRVVIGTVQGDLHDIGKNLVGIMLKGAGFEVIDLGHDVPSQKFVDTAVAEKAGFIGLSSLLTTTMPSMKEVIELVKARGLSGRVKVVIGGAPVNREYAEEIGADSFAFDAMNAVDVFKHLLET